MARPPTARADSGRSTWKRRRYNFLQASIYRLKLSDIPNRPGVELYPTLEVVPSKAKTCTFLSHSAVPVVFTEEDFEQVAAGNFVVKVIYLPDPQFQDLAATGPDEVVSSRLEPGMDPIVEAKRRGSILLVVRLGNIDLEAPNTPAMDSPNPFHPQAADVPAGTDAAGDAGPAGHAAPDGTEYAAASADGSLRDAERPAVGRAGDAAESGPDASGTDVAVDAGRAGHVPGGRAALRPAGNAAGREYEPVAQQCAVGGISAQRLGGRAAADEAGEALADPGRTRRADDHLGIVGLEDSVEFARK